MAKLEFKPATRKQLKVKIGLFGTAGTGKTWNALAVADALAGTDGTIAVIDSERGRAEAYAGDFKFDHLRLPGYAPETYIEALSVANDEGYDVIVVDGISHEWMGRDGILSSVDRFGGWKEATPRHDAFIESLFRLPRNVIATMRAKTHYTQQEVETDSGRKRQEVIKLGVGPIQRDSVEYEFDLLGMLELDHTIKLHKSVIAGLPSGTVLEPGDNPRALGREIAWAVKEWIETGEEVPTPVEADERDVAWLRRLLDEEGFDSEMIKERFKKRRLELGALTPEYVSEQVVLAVERLGQKGVELAPIEADFAAKGGSQQPPDGSPEAEATTEPPEPSAVAEGQPEPQKDEEK